MADENLTINYSKIKQQAVKVLVSISSTYELINKQLLFFWRKVLERQTDNRITKGLLILIENPATALFLNTLLFAAVGHIFGGLISSILFTMTAINIVLFCANILKWKDKLTK